MPAQPGKVPSPALMHGPLLTRMAFFALRGDCLARTLSPNQIALAGKIALQTLIVKIVALQRVELT